MKEKDASSRVLKVGMLYKSTFTWLPDKIVHSGYLRILLRFGLTFVTNE